MNMGLLEDSLLKVGVHLVDGKLKKKTSFAKNLFVDTEELSKMWISWQVIFKDFVNSFGATCLKNEFLWRYFLRILLVDFRKV